MPSVLDQYFDDLDGEFAATRRMLERFPDAQADWTPHEKSMTLIRLAAHVATLPRFAERILTSDEMDFAIEPYTPPVARTAAELLALHDEATAAARKALATMPAERLGEPWTLRMGKQVLLRDRRGKLLRQNLVSHTAHHRGQLSVYYRLLGVPVPGIYGPSADES